LRDPDRFEAWLGRLLVNACRDHARKSKRRPIEVRVLPIDHELADDGTARLIERDAIERAFLRLPVEQRAALVLTHYLGYEAAAVAEAFGIPVGTVYSRLHYGAAAMREALATPAPTTTTASEHVR
jgi:RNA polymerase sigma-70 factor (ECF subfamily)